MHDVEVANAQMLKCHTMFGFAVAVSRASTTFIASTTHLEIPKQLLIEFDMIDLPVFENAHFCFALSETFRARNWLNFFILQSFAHYISSRTLYVTYR